MARGKMRRIAAAVAGILFSVAAYSQTEGTFSGYSPYSVYGIGNLHSLGNAYSFSRGGTGIADRNHRFMNILNPASVTARDSLSFMADFGLSGKASLFRDGNSKGIGNIYNISDFAISFPLWRNAAFMVGLTPFSDIGYSTTTTEKSSEGESSIGYTGSRTYAAGGTGSVYQLFAGGGVTLWNRLSIGAQYMFLFGNIDKYSSVSFSESSFRSIAAGDTIQVKASTVKFGLQYEQPLGGNYKLSLGATYRMKAAMRGQSIAYDYWSMSSDGNRISRAETPLKGEGLSFGDELGAGLSFRKGDKWAVQMDYTRGNWTGTGFDSFRGFMNNSSHPFTGGIAQSIRGGFEIVPNANDIRHYLNRATYRAGAYFEQSYYKVDGKPLGTVGITIGATLPVYIWYNGLTVALEAGYTGLGGAPVKETFFSFHVGFNIFDIWFRKYQYE